MGTISSVDHGASSATSLRKIKGLIPTIVSVFCAFGCWALLLPVIPAQIIAAGDGDTLAGLSTGLFMAATVVTQAFVPRALRTIGYIPVMVAAGLLLGIPAVLYVIDGGPWLVMVVSIIRGIGFGAITVAQSALLAELVPLRSLGRANGMLGIAIGAGELIGFPLGLSLFDRHGDVVYLVAAGVGILGALVVVSVPPLVAGTAHSGKSGDGTGAQKITWTITLVPIIAVCAGAMGFGALSTFAAPAVEEISPAAAATVAGFTLAAAGCGQMAGRWLAGVIADRTGAPGRCIIAASSMATVGIFGVALTLVLAPVGAGLVAMVLCFAVIFGAGFGAVQNEALLMLFDRLSREKASEASAMWNMAFDSGTGLGAVVLGLIAASIGYSSTFGVAGLLVGMGVVVVTIDRVRRGTRAAEGSGRTMTPVDY